LVKLFSSARQLHRGLLAAGFVLATVACATIDSTLRTLQQRTKEFSVYFAEFQRYAADVSWDEPSRRAALKAGLSSKLQQDLITLLDEPENLQEWVTVCQKLDNRRRAFQQQFGLRPSAPASAAAYVPPRTSNAPPPASTSSGTHSGPMNLSATRSRYRPSLTKEEKVRRIAQGLCLYCEGVGHLAGDCPNENKKRNLQFVATFTSTSTFNLEPATSDAQSSKKA
jgi:hypothetical protein